MTRDQIELARHALGLTGGRTVSYRNRFIAGKDHPAYQAWFGLVAADYAVKFDGKGLDIGGNDFFKLSTAGAVAVLQPGERLDEEDFPKVAAANAGEM